MKIIIWFLCKLEQLTDKDVNDINNSEGIN